MRKIVWFGLVVIVLLSGACGNSRQPSVPVFIAPTLAATQPPTQTAIPIAVTPQPTQPSRPTSTPFCENNLTYLEDANLPDGSVVSVGETLQKQWKVRNSGECSWDSRYRFKLVEGEALGATAEQALYPARAGTDAVLTLRFTAPAEPGSYRSAWQAIDPQGNPFGDPVYLLIEVQ